MNECSKCGGYMEETGCVRCGSKDVTVILDIPNPVKFSCLWPTKDGPDVAVRGAKRRLPNGLCDRIEVYNYRDSANNNRIIPGAECFVMLSFTLTEDNIESLTDKQLYNVMECRIRAELYDKLKMCFSKGKT